MATKLIEHKSELPPNDNDVLIFFSQYISGQFLEFSVVKKIVPGNVVLMHWYPCIIWRPTFFMCTVFGVRFSNDISDLLYCDLLIGLNMKHVVVGTPRERREFLVLTRSH